MNANMIYDYWQEILTASTTVVGTDVESHTFTMPRPTGTCM